MSPTFLASLLFRLSCQVFRSPARRLPSPSLVTRIATQNSPCKHPTGAFYGWSYREPYRGILRMVIQSTIRRTLRMGIQRTLRMVIQSTIRRTLRMGIQRTLRMGIQSTIRRTLIQTAPVLQLDFLPAMNEGGSCFIEDTLGSKPSGLISSPQANWASCCEA
jgi:hypothetical protein